MSDKNEKYYTPQEAAAAIIEKCKELYKNSTLAKANTAHELESGGEPNNDDAEAPEQLQAGEVCKEGSFSSDKKKDKKKEGDSSEEGEESEDEDSVSEEEASAMESVAEEEAEEEVEEHNDQLHGGKDHKDSEDEEDKENKKDKDKDKDKDMEKSLFKDKAVKCSPVENKTKEDVFYDIKWCVEKLQKMKELKWTIEDEAPEAKNVFDKEFDKEKAKISKLVKKYNSLKKGEETDEETSILKKAERVVNDKPTTLKNFMRQKALKKKA